MVPSKKCHPLKVKASREEIANQYLLRSLTLKAQIFARCKEKRQEQQHHLLLKILIHQVLVQIPRALKTMCAFIEHTNLFAKGLISKGKLDDHFSQLKKH